MIIHPFKHKVRNYIGLAGLALMAGAASANTVDIKVQPSPRAFLIATNICMYGASNASALKEYSLQLVKKQFFVDKSDIEQQLQKKYGVTQSQAEQLVIGSAFKSDTINLQQDIKKVGNELCGTANTELTIKLDEDISALIPFSTPLKYHWIATEAEHNLNVKNILSQYKWPTNDVWINAATTEVTTLIDDNITKNYYLFDTDKYLAFINERNKTVYVNVADKHRNAINQYLSDYGFEVQMNPESAYWHLNLTVLPNLENVLVNLEIKSESETINLESDAIPFSLSTSNANASNDAQLNKLIKVHLTMMDLSGRLSFQAK